MWTTENRARYDRSTLRYPGDLTDDEWSLIAPLIPPAKRGGREWQKDERELVNAIMYGLSTGCQWRYIPKDLPPKSTLTRTHHTLSMLCREQAGREASPTACVIDSQSVKSAEKGGPASIRTAMMLASLDLALHQQREGGCDRGTGNARLVHRPRGCGGRADGWQDRRGGDGDCSLVGTPMRMVMSTATPLPTDTSSGPGAPSTMRWTRWPT